MFHLSSVLGAPASEELLHAEKYKIDKNVNVVAK